MNRKLPVVRSPSEPFRPSPPLVCLLSAPSPIRSAAVCARNHHSQCGTGLGVVWTRRGMVSRRKMRNQGLAVSERCSHK